MATKDQIREAELYLCMGIAMGGCTKGGDFMVSGWSRGEWLDKVWHPVRMKYLIDDKTWRLNDAGLEFIKNYRGYDD